MKISDLHRRFYFPKSLNPQIPHKFTEQPSFQSSMASTSAVTMALPLTYAAHNRLSNHAFFNPLPSTSRTAIGAAPLSNGRLVVVRSSMKEKAVAGLTAAALAAATVIPEVAEAAGSGVTPSLKNFLLSIGAGGAVVFALLGAIIGVSNFDPVKRS